MMSGGKKTRKKRKIQYGGVTNDIKWMNFNEFLKHVNDLANKDQKPEEVWVKPNAEAGNKKIEIFISAEGSDDFITLYFKNKVKAGEQNMSYFYNNDEEEGEPNMMFQTNTIEPIEPIKNGGQKKTKKRKRRRKLKKKRKSKKKRKTRKKRKLRKKRKSVKN